MTLRESVEAVLTGAPVDRISLETIKQTTHDLLAQAGTTENFIMAITEDIPDNRWQANLLEISKVLSSGVAGEVKCSI